MSLRGAKRRGNPHPQNLTILYASSLKTEHLGERIATPVCGLVRNDMFFDTLRTAASAAVLFYLQSSEWDRQGGFFERKYLENV